MLCVFYARGTDFLHGDRISQDLINWPSGILLFRGDPRFIQEKHLEHRSRPQDESSPIRVVGTLFVYVKVQIQTKYIKHFLCCQVYYHMEFSVLCVYLSLGIIVGIDYIYHTVRRRSNP